MTDLHPDLPHLASEHPVVFGWLPDRNRAELALADLMAAGLSEQDVTLVEPSTARASAASLASAVVPVSGTRNGSSRERESSIGGGIATLEPDDDVSTIEEMDDSESAAEDAMYPDSGHSYSEEDVHDMEALLGDAAAQRARLRRPETDLSEIAVEGLGLVVGEGSFGTQLLEARYRGGLGAVRRWLWGESTPGIEGETCVLAVDATAEGPSVEEIESVLESRGARFIRRTGS
jgi:hypothetical protein